MSLIVPYPTSDFQQGACEFPVNHFPLGRINELIFMAYPAVLGLYFSRYKLNGFILEKRQQHPSRYYEDFSGLQQRLLVFPHKFFPMELCVISPQPVFTPVFRHGVLSWNRD